MFLQSKKSAIGTVLLHLITPPSIIGLPSLKECPVLSSMAEHKSPILLTKEWLSEDRHPLAGDSQTKTITTALLHLM